MTQDLASLLFGVSMMVFPALAVLANSGAKMRFPRRPREADRAIPLD